MPVNPVPDRLGTVTPSIVCTPCADAIEFYKDVFRATEVSPRMTGPDGTVAHAEIMIGNSVIMMGDEWPEGPVKSPQTLGGSTAAFFIYTENVRAMWDRAIEAGCQVIFPLELQFYGDLGGRVQDPFGHTWGLGEHVEDVSDEEMEKRVAAFYEEQGQ